jgi:hypothetical protein
MRLPVRHDLLKPAREAAGLGTGLKFRGSKVRASTANPICTHKLSHSAPLYATRRERRLSQTCPSIRDCLTHVGYSATGGAWSEVAVNGLSPFPDLMRQAGNHPRLASPYPGLDYLLILQSLHRHAFSFLSLAFEACASHLLVTRPRRAPSHIRPMQAAYHQYLELADQLAIERRTPRISRHTGPFSGQDVRRRMRLLISSDLQAPCPAESVISLERRHQRQKPTVFNLGPAIFVTTSPSSATSCNLCSSGPPLANLQPRVAHPSTQK